MAVADVKRELKETVMEQLTWDDRVLSTDIDVTVEEGKVTLHGHVPTYFSRLAAEEDVRSVIGVTAVENKLIVQHPEEFTVPEDGAIKKAIEDMLELDNRIDAQEIIIEVNSGAVTLKGVVDAFWRKALIEDYVNRAKGVIDVINNLRIVPAFEIEDEKIREDVRNALNRNAVTSNIDVDIIVHAGEVTLNGTVQSHVERHTARDLAYCTSGVRHVKNNLKLSYSTPRPDTY